MIPRYTLPEMGRLWNDETKFQTWLEIEILACEALARAGKIPADVPAIIRQKAKIDVTEIEQLEKITRHDVVAFLRSIAEKVGPPARYIHLGLTSSDIVDTALSVLLVRATPILIKDVEDVIRVLEQLA
ncbi:MAG: lyase family protein, partial [Candidatus Sumerlaeia bacterium]|nr:lyase family protein [Candidatus Sumerlaeia bacterium]